MDAYKAQALNKFRDELVDEVRDSNPVLETLVRAGLTIRRIEPAEKERPSNGKPRTWLLYCEPESVLRERFDLAPGLLVVLIPGRKAQARDIRSAEEFLLRDYRLDRGLVLAIARDEGARDQLELPARETRRTYVFLSFAEVTGAGDPQAWLRGVLLDALGSSDLFAPGPPVVGWDFVGRKQELDRIRKHLDGGRPVGLYGLRKIGKTSLLFNLRKQLLDESKQAIESGDDTARVTLPIYLDTQTISFAEQNRAGFMRAFIRNTREALSDLGIMSNVGLDPDFGKAHSLSKLDPDAAIRAGIHMLEMLIDWAREHREQRRLVLLIDEYERLLEDKDFPLRDGLQVLTYLRGVLQSYPGNFNFLIAGRSRTLAFMPRLAGQQNPLLNLLIDFPLAGLGQQEMKDLISKIGRRLSLNFDYRAIERVWEETGGHPFLAREFGRIVDEQVPVKKRTRGAIINEATITGLQDSFRRQVEPTLQEIADAVDMLDPDVLFTLNYIQLYPKESREVLAAMPGNILDELCRYGILEEQNGGWRVRIGCFGDWVRQNYDSRRVFVARAGG